MLMRTLGFKKIHLCKMLLVFFHGVIELVMRLRVRKIIVNSQFFRPCQAVHLKALES
jgi:hypothetical protein